VALADWLLERFGRERAAWAMLVAAFLVGLPIFFEVGSSFWCRCVEPGARDQAVGAFLWPAHGRGAHHHAFDGATASAPAAARNCWEPI